MTLSHLRQVLHGRVSSNTPGSKALKIVNEAGLARLLESTDAQFDPETLAIIRDKRKYCPKCQSVMVVRTTKQGLSAGRQFWGCSTFPRCRFKMPLS